MPQPIASWISRLISPQLWRRALWATVHLAKYGKPNVVLSFGGGLGDQLMLTTVARELRKRGETSIWVSTRAPQLFLNNPDIDRITDGVSVNEEWFLRRFDRNRIRASYSRHIPDERRDVPPNKHLLAVICEQAGIRGEVALRPYLHLSNEEASTGNLAKRQIAIQSTGKSAQHFMWTKEWYPDRFQSVVDALRGDFNFIQIGSRDDPRLEGTLDLRGKTSLRESAAILSNSVLFVGLVGFMMHLARAVECRSVIVYGGRELPSQSGYTCNVNLTSPTECSPCWRYDSCPGNRLCMDKITANDVVDAILLTTKNLPEQLQTANWIL